MNKRKKASILLGLLVGSMCLSFLPVLAEGNDTEKYPIIDRDYANLTIRYFDDSEETVPSAGTEFTVMKVADIGRDINDGTNGRYMPLVSELDFTGIEENNGKEAYEYEQTVVSVYEQKGKDFGYQTTKAVGNDGTASFKLPVGAYLVRETKTMRYHIRSKPFLVSVPETNKESNSWNFDVVAYPKQQLAGDLSISKQIIGKSSKSDDVFHVQITLNCEGTYKATLADGSTGEVTDGSEIAIRGNQKITVYDLPSGTEYKVTEKEANADPYKTGYKNQTGKIEAKKEIEAKVINDTTQWDNVHTGEGSQIIIAMMVGVGALALLLFLLVGRDKKETTES